MLTFHIVSLGCPKNTVDAEVMLGHASARGLRPVEDPADADILVVNTCGFIEPAKKESIDTIFSLAQHKTSGRCQRLVVTGCLTQRYANDIADQIPEIDFLVGTGDVLHVADAMEGKGTRIHVGPAQGFLSTASTPRMLSRASASAYVKIAEGCDRHCAFCVIPKIKGPHRSRSIDDIVKEAEQLVDQGVIELNLVSQDTLVYGRDLEKSSTLPALVRRLADVKGLHWVRLLYLYPDELDDALIDLLANHPNVVPYVDMPMQHASSAVLKRMRRGHGERRLRRIVERLRKGVPNLSLRSAFIVGFPGETDEEFEELLSFLTWARFDHVGVFRYSDEEDTTAVGLSRKVGASTSYNRFRKLMAAQRKISRANNRRRKGQRVQVLVEGPSAEHAWVLSGRHAGQAPEIDGQVLFTESDVAPGQIWWADVKEAMDYDLVVRTVGDGPLAASRLRLSLPVLK
jgi:ribosomal protein S12 methylthiotransferase